jgi:DNA ligase (NAD+)
MGKLDIHEGDTVLVEKGGEIIPKIVGVNTSKRELHARPYEFINKCPECGTPLQRNEGEAAHFCPNIQGCPPQLKGRLEHFISRRAMDIDSLGEGKIEMLFEKGLVKDAADLYDLKYENLFGLEKIFPADDDRKERKISFKDKTVNNILQGIEESKNVQFERVLFALGIRHVGETVAKKLARHYGDIDSMIKEEEQGFISVGDIGPKIAQELKSYFSDDGNIRLIERLVGSGLQFAVLKPETSIPKVLEGQSFVISGSFDDFSRDELKDLVEQHGGKNVSSVSSKTDFIIAGQAMGPAKKEKAEKLGVPIITLQEFLSLLNT